MDLSLTFEKVLGIGLVPLVTLAVTWLRYVEAPGANSKAAGLYAVGLAELIYLGYLFADAIDKGRPVTLTVLFVAVVTAFTSGLASVGLHSTIKNMSEGAIQTRRDDASETPWRAPQP